MKTLKTLATLVAILATFAALGALWNALKGNFEKDTSDFLLTIVFLGWAATSIVIIILGCLVSAWIWKWKTTNKTITKLSPVY